MRRRHVCFVLGRWSTVRSFAVTWRPEGRWTRLGSSRTAVSCRQDSTQAHSPCSRLGHCFWIVLVPTLAASFIVFSDGKFSSVGAFYFVYPCDLEIMRSGSVGNSGRSRTISSHPLCFTFHALYVFSLAYAFSARFAYIYVGIRSFSSLVC